MRLDNEDLPRNSVWNGRVDSSCTKECSGVLNVDVSATEKHCESCHGTESTSHVEITSPASSISNPADCNGQDCCNGVRWDGEKLDVVRQ